MKTYKEFNDNGVVIKMTFSNDHRTELPDLPEGLLELEVSHNNVTKLPKLPDSLIRLSVFKTKLEELPELPKGLKDLYVHTNNMKSLGKLPPKLKDLWIGDIENIDDIIIPKTVRHLHISNCNIKKIPELPKLLKKLTLMEDNVEVTELPEKLKDLVIGENDYVEVLPKLPNTLKLLMVFRTNLKEIPELPYDIKGVSLKNNKLKFLPPYEDMPNLPGGFNFQKNPYEYPLDKIYAEGYGYQQEWLYTQDRLNLFGTDEWQRQFLTEYPEKYENIDWIVTDNIKGEFDYIYGAKDLGLL